MAGVGVIVPVAVVAGITASGTDAGNSSSLLAMDGAQPGTEATGAHLDTGLRLTGAARQEVARLGVSRVLAERAADRRADRRAARLAAARAAARAAVTPSPSPSPSSAGTTGSAPRPSANPQKIAEGMLGSYGWSSSQ